MTDLPATVALSVMGAVGLLALRRAVLSPGAEWLGCAAVAVLACYGIAATLVLLPDGPTIVPAVTALALAMLWRAVRSLPERRAGRRDGPNVRR